MIPPGTSVTVNDRTVEVVANDPTLDNPTRGHRAGDIRENWDKNGHFFPALAGIDQWVCRASSGGTPVGVGGIDPGVWDTILIDPSGGTVTGVTGTAPITVTPASPNPNVSHDNSGVTPGTYNQVLVDAKGHVTLGGVTPDPYVLFFTYGPLGGGPPNASGSDGTLPILAGGEGTPIFWLRPSTDINNVSAVGTVSDQFIVEWYVDTVYTTCAIQVFVRHVGLSSSDAAPVTMTMAVTKNGTATATGVAIPASETDTAHLDSQSVVFTIGDLVGVRVSFSSNYASGTLLCTVRVKLT